MREVEGEKLPATLSNFTTIHHHPLASNHYLLTTNSQQRNTDYNHTRTVVVPKSVTTPKNTYPCANAPQGQFLGSVGRAMHSSVCQEELLNTPYYTYNNKTLFVTTYHFVCTFPHLNRFLPREFLHNR